MLMPSGYIIQKLTGKFSMNRPRMSLTSLSDIRTGEWSREIAKKAEIPFSLLPTPYDPATSWAASPRRLPTSPD